mgnify:CR=1 FL=1
MPLNLGSDFGPYSCDRQGITNQSHHEILSVALFYGLDSLSFLFLEIKKKSYPWAWALTLVSVPSTGRAKLSMTTMTLASTLPSSKPMISRFPPDLQIINK